MIAWLLSAVAAPLPPIPPPAPQTPPAIEARALSNGIPVLILPHRPTGTFEVRLVLRAGAPLDPAGLEGLAGAAFDLADESAGGLDAAAFSAAVRAAGAELVGAAEGDGGAIGIVGLRRNLDRALDLWSQAILSPSFSEDDLRLVRQRWVDGVTLRQRDPAGLADRVQAALQYGDGYLGRSPDEGSLRALDSGAIRQWWTAWVGPADAAILAGGDLRADELLPLLEARLGGWTGGTRVEIEADPAPVARETLVLVDRPGAPEAAIRAFVPVGGIHDPARAALDVAIAALGGASTSRVDPARCEVVYLEGPGFLQCSARVRSDTTAQALAELRQELLEAISDRPLSEEEVQRHRDASLRALASEQETTARLLSELGRSWARGLPVDSLDGYQQALSRVDRSAADAALRAHLVPERLSWLVVGDRAALRPALEALDLPVVDYAP